MALKKITRADFDDAIKANVENGKVVWWKVLGTTDEGTDLCLVVGWGDGSDLDKEDRENSYFDDKNDWVLRAKIGYAHSNLYAMDYDDFYMPYNLADDKKNGIYKGDVWDTDMTVGKGGPSDFDIKWYNDEAKSIWDAFGTPKGEDEEAPLDLMESKKTKGESKMKKCSMQKKIESVGKKSEIRTNLEPRFDSRKSFYGKAQVDDEGGSKTLYSYNTPVARVTDGKLELLPKWNFSQTTRRHVADFAKQMGVEDQYLKLKKGESKGCSMQKKIESLAKKNEGDNGAWAWTVTVEFDDNGKTTSKKYVVNAHNRESAVDQAKLRPLRSNPDAKNIKVVRCDMGESFSKKSEASYGYGDIRVSDEDVLLTVNEASVDERGGSFSVDVPEEGQSYSLREMKDMLQGMCEDCTGYTDISRDGSDIRIAVLAGDLDDNSEWTGDYYDAYVVRCTARIMSTSLEGVVDYLSEE